MLTHRVNQRVAHDAQTHTTAVISYARQVAGRVLDVAEADAHALLEGFAETAASSVALNRLAIGEKAASARAHVEARLASCAVDIKMRTWNVMTRRSGQLVTVATFSIVLGVACVLLLSAANRRH